MAKLRRSDPLDVLKDPMMAVPVLPDCAFVYFPASHGFPASIGWKGQFRGQKYGNFVFLSDKNLGSKELENAKEIMRMAARYAFEKLSGGGYS